MGIEIFYLFGLCDLEIDPMTFMYKFDPYSLEIYQMGENKLATSTHFESYRQTDRQTDTQTDRETNRHD